MAVELTGKRMPWDRLSASALVLALVATFLVYGSVMLAFLDRTLEHGWYPFGNDYGEGPVLFQVAALASGESLYRPIAEAPFAVANYPPVFHYVAWLLTGLTGDPLVAGRLASFLGSLASGALIFTLVHGVLHRDHGTMARRLGGAMAALFFLSHYTVIGWSSTMRVDTLALALGLLGMQLFVLALRRPTLAWVYGLAFVMAAFTKPNMFAAALATFAAAFMLDRRRALVAATVFAGAGLAAVVWLAIATDGEFLKHVAWYNINEYRFDLILKRLRQSLFWRGVDIVLLFAGIGYLVIRLISRPEIAPSVARRRDPDLPLMLFGGLMAASLFNVVGAGKTGASVSYFLEFEAAAALLLGTLVVRMTTFLSADRWSPDCGRRRVMAIFALAVLCWQATVGWAVKFREPDWQAIAFSRQVAEMIATADGPVISEEMVLLQRAGKPLYFQPFIMTRLAEDGRWDAAPLTQAMRRGDVAFVVLYSAIGSARYQRRFPEGFRAALETRYDQVAQVGHLGVFAPRQTAPR
ncbi:MAG: glycosyltransferase family 39 protein [Rhodospirillales bacterium]|nr:MAG: glycosyltransferase family 39 protein [Rhodospirillales bacterium]